MAQRIILTLPPTATLLTDIFIIWVTMVIVIVFGLLLAISLKEKKQKKTKKELHLAQSTKDETKARILTLLAGHATYFFRETGKIANESGNELPQLKEYECHLAPFADCEMLPDKAFRVFFDRVRSSKGSKDVLLFRPSLSGWLDGFQVTGFEPYNKVVLSHPTLGSISLINTENQASYIGQEMRVYQVTRFIDGVYSSFCHIPSKQPFSLM